MSTFPNFSQINEGIRKKLDNRKGSTLKVSSLNAFVRVTSGASPGLTLYSNPDIPLFGAAGIYGDGIEAGTYGLSLGLKAKATFGDNAPLRPMPVVTSVEIDEGAGNLSRKATFSITCFSKSQMQLLCEYYLEPGFSMFIEWGWNTSDGVGGLLNPLNGKNISEFQSFQKTDAQREKGGYEYDNYLGFSTGGSLAVDGDKWTINVKCTGYTELPSYLLAAHNTTTNSDGQEGVATVSKLISRPAYGEASLSNAKGDLRIERWMRCYNELPGTRQTKWVKGLKDKLARIENFIGFDEEVASKINNSTDGTNYVIFSRKDTKIVNGKEVEFPEGTEIVSAEKFIKFSALMEIFAASGTDGYYIETEGKSISFTINTKDTICSSFENIFSTDATRLFIPNPNTPSMNLADITDSTSELSVLIGDKATMIDNSVNKLVKFPKDTPCNQPQENNAPNLVIPAFQWGKLDDLYVNFEFAKGIMDTKNFFVKDALYQILNGLSSAVNGIWDFQIEEHASGKETTELRVFEMNAISTSNPPEPYVFTLSGVDSIFIDASFDLDIGGAKMNQIIGNKLSTILNGDTGVIPPGVFGEGHTDIIKLKIKNTEDNAVVDGNTLEDTEDKDAMKNANLNLILGKLSFYPRVELRENVGLSNDLYKNVYLGAFNDSAIFSALKSGLALDKISKNVSVPNIGPLMPINFSFKIHGVSGIKRGDMFKVLGVPDTYYKRGFFQVTGVKHIIDGMQWTTEITGGFRPKRG